MKVRQNQVILIVEDSPVDYETTVRALKKAGVANNIQHCEDGDQALDYLFHRGSYYVGSQSEKSVFSNRYIRVRCNDVFVILVK